MMEKIRKIQSLKIEHLFDRYNYNLVFDEDSHYLILTSPNGYGKTTILTIVDALAKSDLFYFYFLPFNCISLSFTDNTEIVIKSLTPQSVKDENEASPDESSEGGREIVFLWRDPKGGESRYSISEKLFRKAFRAVGYYEGRRLAMDESASPREIREFVRNNPQILAIMAREQNSNAFLLQIKELQTVFIEAQRVYCTLGEQRNYSIHSERNSSIPNYTIDEISKKIMEKMRRAKYNYLEYAQNKSNQLIYRLLRDDFKELSCAEYESKRLILDKKIRDLQHYGLIDGADIPEYEASHSKVISAYMAEMEEKLSKLDEIFNKVILFSDLIARKHFTAKTIDVKADRGIRALTEGNKWVSLSDLSSGEQNIIIMLYYLVFEYDSNKLLLIDEPEISIHVAWQYQYMDELEEILKLVNGQAIVATHSPQIIGERWDKCYDLTEQ